MNNNQLRRLKDAEKRAELVQIGDEGRIDVCVVYVTTIIDPETGERWIRAAPAEYDAATPYTDGRRVLFPINDSALYDVPKTSSADGEKGDARNSRGSS